MYLRIKRVVATTPLNSTTASIPYMFELSDRLAVLTRLHKCLHNAAPSSRFAARCFKLLGLRSSLLLCLFASAAAVITSSIYRPTAAMAKVVLLSKLDSKGKKGAWLRLQEDEPARTREELLYHFGCSVLDGTHVETGSRFYKHEEVWFVVERLLVQDGLDKGAKALQVWDVQMQKHVSFAFKYEAPDDLHSMD